MKVIYDIIWNDYSFFIDKDSEEFMYLYSNKQNEGSANKKEIKQRSKKTLIHYLFRGLKEQKIFEKYELELTNQGFLNNNKNKWLDNASSLMRFYNYCETMNLFKKEFYDSREGVLLLRSLYNFHSSADLNSPKKRRSQENKKNKYQYIFLKKITSSTYNFSKIT